MVVYIYVCDLLYNIMGTYKGWLYNKGTYNSRQRIGGVYIAWVYIRQQHIRQWHILYGLYKHVHMIGCTIYYATIYIGMIQLIRAYVYHVCIGGIYVCMCVCMQYIGMLYSSYVYRCIHVYVCVCMCVQSMLLVCGVLVVCMMYQYMCMCMCVLCTMYVYVYIYIYVYVCSYYDYIYLCMYDLVMCM